MQGTNEGFCNVLWLPSCFSSSNLTGHNLKTTVHLDFSFTFVQVTEFYGGKSKYLNSSLSLSYEIVRNRVCEN